jgi:cell division protein FtsW (lipid II flippase)
MGYNVINRFHHHLFLPTNWFRSLSMPVYLSSILLLLIVITIGKTVSGQKSWLIIGPLGFQPSELAKLGVIMALAAFLSKKSIDIESFKRYYHCPCNRTSSSYSYSA